MNRRGFRLAITLLLALQVLVGTLAPSAYADPRPLQWPFSQRVRRFLFGPIKPKTSIRSPDIIASQVSLDDLRAEISDRTTRVAPFVYIKKWADSHHVRVWLFGGTAASFAHYVHWDMLREKGDTRFYPSQFDYHYTSIFRSNQDLDLVVDAEPALAAELQSTLASHFPYLQGNKSAWEVRLLRKDHGDKIALVNNRHFLEQHSDSHSVGMVELTQASGEGQVRDLREWDNSVDPTFLKDVHEFKLHYYWSSSHDATSRAKEGLNPPILSVVRYLIKAFQFELSISEEDQLRLEYEVRRFRMDGINRTYVTHWLEKNGPKLIQNAVNVEYVFEVLDALGIRSKMIAWSGDPEKENSLAWWLSRKPLKTYPVGRGRGATAASLGITTVAHETKSFEVFESITRAHNGSPNVLVSQTLFTGESAAYGEGFYTAKGFEGMRNTGLTIRFQLDPQAREGSDFTRHEADTIVLIHNKAAIRVIPESVRMGIVQYFALLMQGGMQFKSSDRGVMEQLRRRIAVEMHQLTVEEESELAALAAQIAHESKSGFLPDGWVSEAKRLLDPKLFTKLHPLLTQLPLEASIGDLDIWKAILEHWKQDPKGSFEQYLTRWMVDTSHSLPSDNMLISDLTEKDGLRIFRGPEVKAFRKEQPRERSKSVARFTQYSPELWAALDEFLARTPVNDLTRLKLFKEFALWSDDEAFAKIVARMRPLERISSLGLLTQDRYSAAVEKYRHQVWLMKAGPEFDELVDTVLRMGGHGEPESLYASWIVEHRAFAETDLVRRSVLIKEILSGLESLEDSQAAPHARTIFQALIAQMSDSELSEYLSNQTFLWLYVDEAMNEKGLSEFTKRLQVYLSTLPPRGLPENFRVGLRSETGQYMPVRLTRMREFGLWSKLSHESQFQVGSEMLQNAVSTFQSKVTDSLVAELRLAWRNHIPFETLDESFAVTAAARAVSENQEMVLHAYTALRRDSPKVSSFWGAGELTELGLTPDEWARLQKKEFWTALPMGWLFRMTGRSGVWWALVGAMHLAPMMPIPIGQFNRP